MPPSSSFTFNRQQYQISSSTTLPEIDLTSAKTTDYSSRKIRPSTSGTSSTSLSSTIVSSLLSKKSIAPPPKLPPSSSSVNSNNNRPSTSSSSTATTTKELLQDSRRGCGRGLKFLRAQLQERPDIKKKFLREVQAEEENVRQRDKLLWSKIQNSRVHSCNSTVKKNTYYTNPLGIDDDLCYWFDPAREEEKKRREMRLALKRQNAMKHLKASEFW